MRSGYAKLASLLLLLLFTSVHAEEPAHRFEVVVKRLADAINNEDFLRTQKDFGKVMLDAFPLKKSEAFYKKLMTDYGKIKYLDAPELLPQGQAIFPAHFERAVLGIKVALDNQDKITGLWFIPHPLAIPTPEQHSTELELPFNGRWFVYWGGNTKELNYHHDTANQKYAFDFLKVDHFGKTYRNEGRTNEDYYAFGQKVLSPADGEVTDVIRGVRDNSPGSMNPYSALGNAVIIKHRKLEFSVLAHFKLDSIQVNMGDRVKKGQVLGLCGNSGNSSEPHIHYHLQNTPIIQDGTGIQCIFSNIVVSKNGKTRTEDAYSPVKDDIIANK